MLCSTDVSRDSRITSCETTIASAPTGTLTKKIQFQLMCSMIRPPPSGPIASASAETPAQIPIAVPRCFGGNVATMIDSVAGFMSAAPDSLHGTRTDEEARSRTRARRRATTA